MEVNKLREFSELHNIPMSTLYKQVKRGYCKWPPKPRDGRRKHPLYMTWITMLTRCYNQNNFKYERYGARGIDVCAHWRADFANFLEDMGEKPGSNYTLDRIDNDLGYSPENCRWALHSVQSRNRTTKKTSKYIGVYWAAYANKWRAKIAGHGRPKHLGYFETEEEARDAYIKADKTLREELGEW